MKNTAKSLVLMLCAAMLLVLFSDCSRKLYTVDNMPDKKILVGSGGGFTGIYTNYLFLENGQIFKQTGPEMLAESFAQMEKKASKALWESFEQLNFTEITHSKPGNMTYFVGFADEEIDHKVVWGAPNQDPPREVKQFYGEAMGIVAVFNDAKREEQSQEKIEKEEPRIAQPKVAPATEEEPAAPEEIVPETIDTEENDSEEE